MEKGKLYTLKIKSKYRFIIQWIYIILIIVNSAQFKDAKKYLMNSSEKNNFIKVYFTRKNISKNILENTSSSLATLEDKKLFFNKDDIIKL